MYQDRLLRSSRFFFSHLEHEESLTTRLRSLSNFSCLDSPEAGLAFVIYLQSVWLIGHFAQMKVHFFISGASLQFSCPILGTTFLNSIILGFS